MNTFRAIVYLLILLPLFSKSQSVTGDGPHSQLIIRGVILINGDGSPVRSYLYPVDLSNFLLNLFTINQSMISVNVGSSHAITIKDLAYKILKITNSNKKVIIKNTGAGHPEKSNFYIPNTTYAKSLGFKETISIDDSIFRTFSFYKT